jgi:hypothetical protein
MISPLQFARDQQLDDQGVAFSIGSGEGEVSWYTTEHGKVKGRLQHIDGQSHLVTSFQCQAYYTFCGINAISGPSSVNVGTTATYYSGNAMLCVNNQGDFCSGSPSGGTSASWQWSGFSNFSLQGSSTQSSVSLKATSPGSNTLMVQGTAGSCLFYQTMPVQVKPNCPSTISVGSLTSMPLSSMYPGKKTGIGVVAAMQVGPGQFDWTSSQLTESVSLSTNSCPANGWPTPCQGTSSFSIDTAGTAINGQQFPAQVSVFYDQHASVSNVSLLDYSGINSCTTVCTQQYSCAGTPVGNPFTITYTYTKGTLSGQPVTNVGVTKH